MPFAKKRTHIPRFPVVILCGGQGTRLAEETETKPKPLVEIGGKPILWHIMQHYSAHGFQDFILCLGHKGDLIREFFLNYDLHSKDVRVTFGSKVRRPTIEILGAHDEVARWSVTLAETGSKALTGARVKRIERYVDAEHFLLTYGDGVSDVDVSEAVRFHLKHGKIGTVTGVRPPARFGELAIDSNKDGYRVSSFIEKPLGKSKRGSLQGFINGGFFVFSREFFKYLSSDDACVLEQKPLERLARDKELMMHKHDGFWQCMDTLRDLNLLRELWERGRAPWRTWK